VGNDQADLRDVITPPVALEVQSSIGYDLVIVHHHQALDPASVELGGTSFHHPAAGHVNPQVLAIFFGEGTKKLELVHPSMLGFSRYLPRTVVSRWSPP
jgi:hypothetical protein